MTYKNELFPEQCYKCGETFDLVYELKIQDIEEQNGKIKGNPLCWYCRTNNPIKIKASHDSIEESNDDFLLELEFETDE